VIYIDTSAAMKLIVEEDGSDFVARVFQRSDGRVSSRLLAIELHSGAHRRGVAVDDVDPTLDSVSLVSLDDHIAEHAIGMRSGLRALDALHLATATLLAPILTGFLSFDSKLNAAAAASGLPLVGPDWAPTSSS
jgi:uncharacterized protein